MAAIVFFACLALYALTLHPSVAGGDAGELVAVAYKLGLAHPPGYPLYTLLAHAFTWIPHGTIAWRVNLFSAVCDAAAAAFLFEMVRRVSRDTVAAAAAALLFASCPLIWTYATHAEVFALNNLFVAVLLWLAARWSERREPGVANAIALCIGLALTNHHTFVLVAVPVVAWMIGVTRGAILAPRALARLAACFLAGLLPYVYLPLASPHATTISWGDPATVAGFLDVLLRRDYGTFHLSGTSPVDARSYLHHLALFAKSFATGSMLAGPLLAAVAIASLRPAVRDRASAVECSLLALVTAALVFSVAVFATMANLPLDDPFYLGVTSRFWQQPELLGFVLAGFGLARIRRLPVLRSPAARGVTTACAALVVVLSIGTNFGTHDERDNRFVADYGRAILSSLPPDALLLVRGDLISNAVRYMHTCEGVRPDVVVLDQEMMTKPWYIARARREHEDLTFPGREYHPRIAGDFDMKTFVDVNRERRQIRIYPDVKPGDDAWTDRYVLIPDGISLHVTLKDDVDDATIASVAADSALAPLRSLTRPDETRYGPGTWENIVLNDRKALFHSHGQWLLDRALARKDDRDLFEHAYSALAEAAAEWTWPPPWYVAKNFGLAAAQLARWNPEVRPDAIRAWRSYLEKAPASERDRNAIVEVLGELEK